MVTVTNGCVIRFNIECVYIYIYIYIYVCVCVCVCYLFLLSKGKSADETYASSNNCIIIRKHQKLPLYIYMCVCVCVCVCSTCCLFGIIKYGSRVKWRNPFYFLFFIRVSCIWNYAIWWWGSSNARAWGIQSTPWLSLLSVYSGLDW